MKHNFSTTLKIIQDNTNLRKYYTTTVLTSKHLYSKSKPLQVAKSKNKI